MERIDFPGGFFLVPKKPAEKKESKKVKSSGFHSIFSKEGENEQSERVSNLSLTLEEVEAQLEDALDQVHQLGERLKQDPTLSRVLEYKEGVKRFLRLIVKRCYKIEEKSSSKGILNRKKFIQIQVIDEKLERLAAEVMQTQREQIEILKRVDEIYGALVDLMQ